MIYLSVGFLVLTVLWLVEALTDNSRLRERLKKLEKGEDR